MPANVYECMLIFDSNKFASEPGKLPEFVHKTIENHGGEILASRLWNEQKLAYPIDGHRKGAYWLTYFRMDGTKLASYDRELTLAEPILRHLTLKIDPRLADALVAHARGERLPEEEEPAPEGDAAAPAPGDS